MEEHRTSTGHHIDLPTTKSETMAPGNSIALWVAACTLLLLCSSLSGEFTYVTAPRRRFIDSCSSNDLCLICAIDRIRSLC
jgi:hypothetical protein